MSIKGKKQSIAYVTPCFILFKGLDALENYLSNISTTGDEGTEEYTEIISQLDVCLKQGLGEIPAATPAPAATAVAVEEKVETPVVEEKLVTKKPAQATKKATNKKPATKKTTSKKSSK